MKKILPLIIFLLLISTANGLGIAPSSKETLLTGTQKQFDLHLINNQAEEFTALITIEGPQKSSITTNKDIVRFTKDTTQQTIQVTIDEQELTKIAEGEHKNKIKISQKSDTGSQIETILTLEFDLTIIKPYTEGELAIKLLTPNFKQDQTSTILIEATNIGTKDVTNSISTIDILSKTNTKITTLNSPRKTIKKGETETIRFEWTPKVENGKYIIRATTIYNDKTKQEEKTAHVGTPEINLDTISTTEFSINKVNQLDIILSSNWGETIENIYAETKIIKDQKTISEYKSQNKNIEPLSKTTLPTYWDTSNLEPGTYTMEITINYLGTSKTERIPVTISNENIKINLPSGQITNTKTKEETNTNTFLIVLVLIVITLNIALFIKLRKQK